MLGEARIEMIDGWDVEPIQPDHRLITRVTVVVIGPRGRQYEVAGMHGGALAIDSGVGAFAFDDEAQRGGGVPVAGGDFAWKHELHAGIDALRDARLPAQARVFEN